MGWNGRISGRCGLCTLITLVVFAIAPSAPAAGQSADTPPPPLPHIEFRIEPLVDLVFLARSGQIDDDLRSSMPGLEVAAEKAEAINQAIGAIRMWGFIADALTRSKSAAELVEAARQFPEKIASSRGDGEEHPFREHAVAFVQAIEQIEPAFLEGIWPEREEALERRAATLGESLRSRETEWMTFLLETLDMKSPQEVVPVYLVTDAPGPGAVTYRTREGGACFVSIDMDHDPSLIETVIHESIHALDVSTASEDTAFARLRKALLEAGFSRRDRVMRDVPHVVIFITAAETVRRFFDSRHVDYGECAGVYERIGASATIVREVWLRHLKHEMSLDAAIEEIVRRTRAKDEVDDDHPGTGGN